MPFEAIYSDIQTYEHIKMQESVDDKDDDLDEIYLVHTRDFILNEVEADIVYLQNKTIGKNHVQWDPNYRYKAWYKAKDKVVFSIDQTPKTDPGPFIIEETGEVIAYACNGVEMYDGFHAQQGGKYHVFEYCGDCPSGMNQNGGDGNDINEEHISNQDFQALSINVEKNAKEKEFKVYPNPSDKGFTIEFPEAEGEYIISNINGNIIEQKSVWSKKTFLILPKSIYFIKWINKSGVQTIKTIAL